jgi:hypothetical protein
MIAQVIHDSRRTDRAEMLAEQERENGFRYNLWPAFFFDTPDKHILGPWAAHKNIVRWAKENEMPYVWICEDDVKFTHPKAIEYFESQIPTTPGINLFFGGIWQSVWVGGELRRWSGTHCYIVFSRFYDKLLNAPEKEPIDVWLSRWHSIYGGNRLRTCKPLIASCYDGISGTTGNNLIHSALIGEDNEFYNG